jgi:hypothetical protein
VAASSRAAASAAGRGAAEGTVEGEGTSIDEGAGATVAVFDTFASSTTGDCSFSAAKADWRRVAKKSTAEGVDSAAG